MTKSSALEGIEFPSGANWSETRRNYRLGMLVFAPPSPLREAVDTLRLDYGAYVGSNPPFIVVTQPFARIPEPHEVKALKQIVRRLAPFKVRVGPAIPSPDSRQLCMDLWPQERLFDVRETLHATGLFRTELKFTKNYTFHMRLTETDHEPAEIDQMRAEVNARYPAFETLCSELKWVVPHEDFVFAERMSFFLGA